MILAELLFAAQLFEAGMLICFGLSWPISILKSWRTKFVRGKSQAFLTLIFIGYLSGVMNKLVRAWDTNDWPELVTILYAFNAVLVGIDLVLYFRYRNNTEPANAKAEDVAAVMDEQHEMSMEE